MVAQVMKTAGAGGVSRQREYKEIRKKGLYLGS